MEESTFNSIYFDSVTIDSDIRDVIVAAISAEKLPKVSDNAIYLLPYDYNYTDPLPEFPAVSFDVVNPYTRNVDNTQIAGYTDFSIEINIYTAGENRKLNNNKIALALVALLQSHLYMAHYSSSGFKLESMEFVTSPIDNTSRQVIRMSATCDNKELRIFNY